MMYTIHIVNKSSEENIWYLFCVKLNRNYRYYGMVYNTEYDNCIISLMDSNLKIIDHFKVNKDSSKDAKECFLNFCISYDKFWHPYLFASEEKIIDNQGSISYNT